MECQQLQELVVINTPCKETIDYNVVVTSSFVVWRVAVGILIHQYIIHHDGTPTRTHE